MNIVIFAHARSGSTNLMYLLRSQGLDLEFEPFSPVFQKKYHELQKNGDFDLSLDLLDQEFQGFKHLSFHAEEIQNKKILKRYKVIYLYRENIIDAAMSLVLARLTKVYFKSVALPIYKSLHVNLEPNVVLEIANQIKEHKKYLNDLTDSFVISYEKLFYSKEKEYLAWKLFEFCNLQISNQNVIKYHLSDIHRLNPKIKDRVNNYDYIVEYVKNNIDT